MAGDFNKPALTDSYTLFASSVRDLASDIAKGLDPALALGTTNIPANTIRWNSASGYWEKYNGSVWGTLASTYSINAATSNAWATGRTISLTGDCTATSGTWTGSANLSFATTLATVNSNVGSFGSSSVIPIITVNGKGLITAVSTASLGGMASQASSSVSITGGSISGTSLTLVQSTTAAPTAEGRVEWDTDNDTLMIGTGTATKTFAPLSPDSAVTMTNHTFSTGCTWQGNSLGVQYGGTGVTTLSGLAYGNGTSSFSVATAAQIVAAIGTTAVTNATKLNTARTINGVSFDGSANISIPTINDAGYTVIGYPGGGSYTTTTATVTGAIAVSLPVGMTNSMVQVTIKIFNYATNESFEVHAGGYNFATGTTWANNPYAYIIGNPSINRQLSVRFGYTSGAKAVIYIGELASQWSSPQICVTECLVGYGGQTSTYTSGWSIGFQASAFENVTATVTNPQVGYAVTTNTANSVVLRDASGNFSAGTITASLTGNATNVTGVVAAANGGTGQSSYTVGDLVYASGATTLSKLADVATGNVLISGGIGAAPSYGKVDLTTHISNTLGASNGGTGQSSYAVGDLVYASGTTTLSKLADVATGNVLLSGGVGVAPSYGKVDLTTHITGTLAIGNGGTGGTTAATARSGIGIETSTTGSTVIAAGTEAQRDSSPLAGYFRFNSTSGKFEGYNGTAWGSVGGGATISSVVASTIYYLGLTSASTGEWTDARVSTTGLYFSTTDNTLYATNFNSASDAALKSNVITISDATSKLKLLRGVGFNWKDSGKKSYGVIAQEIEKVLPELVDTINGKKSVNYTALIGFLIEAVKELSEK